MSKYYLIKTDLPPMKLGKAKKGNDYAFVIDSVAELTKEELQVLGYSCIEELSIRKDILEKLLKKHKNSYTNIWFDITSPAHEKIRKVLENENKRK